MAHTVRERELKFDVPDGWTAPELDALMPAGGRVETGALSLDSEYYDTDGRALLGSGVTLRRRTGGRDDTGWQLKIPSDGARLELRLPLGARGVPAELRRLTAGLRGRAALRPLATIRVERTAHRLLDASGELLAEVAVDDVTSHTVREFAVTRTWQEAEIELGPAGTEKLLRRIAEAVTRTAATPSASRSKLSRALDGAMPTGRALAAAPVPDERRLAGVVAAYLEQQFAVLVGNDVRLRQAADASNQTPDGADPIPDRGDPIPDGGDPAPDGPTDDDADDGADDFAELVHTTRVATRRYRSALRVFAAVVDPTRSAALDTELRWYAETLGRVRDRHVLREHLHAALDALAGADLPAVSLTAATARIDAALDGAEAAARADLDTAMASARYATLLAELRDWRLDPPFTADGPAGDVSRFLDDARHTLRRRLHKAAKLPAADAARDEAFHRARKAAKRARYTAELARPVLGHRAAKAARHAKALQTELGGRQDDVLAASFLRELADDGAGVTAGTGGFVLGVLYQRERDLLA